MHEMTRVIAGRDGRDLFGCPECGRLLLVWWKPPSGWSPFEVIREGDESARHAGGTGGAAVAADAVVPVTGADREFLREHGLGW